MKTRTLLSLALLLTTAAACQTGELPHITDRPVHTPAPGDAGAPLCNTTDGTTVVDGLLTGLTPVLNKAWPSWAVSQGLDPLDNAVVNEEISLGCKYGGDEICGVQAAKCLHEDVYLTVSTITGLASVQFQSLTMSSLQAQSGNPVCLYSSAAAGGAHGCSYAGSGTGSVFLLDGTPIKANISKIQVKVKCDIPGIKTWTETLFNGSAQCTASSPTGTGDFNLCAGSCASGVAANLSYAGLSKLNLAVGSLSCKVSPSTNPVSGVAEAIIPTFEKSIVNAVEPPVMSAINGLVAGLMPYPSSCGD